MLSAAAWRVGMARQGIRQAWREVDAFGRLSADAARRALGERLLAQLRYFAGRDDALPEWREAARLPHAEALWEAWPSLPVIGKAELGTRFHPEALAALGVRGRVSSTGGSTGEPTPFVHDAAHQRQISAAGVYCWHRFGWRPGMPVVCVWGSERDIGRQRSLWGRAGLFLRNVDMIDGYALDRSTVDAVLARVRRYPRLVMYGFTSMLEFVAREVLKRGDAVPAGRLRAAWNGGETLFESQSEVFRRAFGVPILNYYGGREMGALAYQPAAGAPLDVLRPWLFVEVLDEQGKPAAPGQTGRLVWTSTVGRGTPFLRYDVGDLGEYGPGDHDASGIRRLAALHGRSAGMIRLPDGRTLHGMYWNHLFKDFPEVEQFQVAWIGGARLELRLRGSGFSAERDAHLRGVVGRLVGEGVPVEVRWVERIPLTAQGKLVQVVQEAAAPRRTAGAHSGAV